MRKTIGLAAIGYVFALGSTFGFVSPAAVDRGLLAADPSANPDQMGGRGETPIQNRLTETTDSSAKQEVEEQDAARLQQIMQEAVKEKLHSRPLGEMMQAIAVKFRGTPYRAGLLDRSSQETLVVSLQGFDCVLFVETVLAIARGVAVQDYSYHTFAGHIQNQRYRNGELSGYCSRLHYFSEWVTDNQKRGTVRDITPSLGGIKLNKKLNFMSTHRDSYTQLASGGENYKCIAKMEANLAGLDVDYIPQNQIRRVYAQMQPGDIVAVATDIPGLDFTHTGLVYRHPNGSIGFIHASPIGRVAIARDLQTYVGNVKHAVGILLARPIDPREKIST